MLNQTTFYNIYATYPIYGFNLKALQTPEYYSLLKIVTSMQSVHIKRTYQLPRPLKVAQYLMCSRDYGFSTPWEVAAYLMPPWEVSVNEPNSNTYFFLKVGTYFNMNTT